MTNGGVSPKVEDESEDYEDTNASGAPPIPKKGATDEDSESRSLNTGKPDGSRKLKEADAEEDYEEEGEEAEPEAKEGAAETVEVKCNDVTEATIYSSTLVESDERK